MLRRRTNRTVLPLGDQARAQCPEGAADQGEEHRKAQNEQAGPG
jgi:hypothetical protein